MKTDKIYGLFYILFLFLIMSCHKYEPVPNRKPVYAPKELKDYCYFLPGTYWIYKDTATGAEDSVYVLTAGNSMDTVYDSDGHLQGVYEWFSVETVSSYDGYNYDYSFHGSYSSLGCNPTESEPCHRIKKVKVKPGDYVGEVWFFVYEFNVGTWVYSSPLYNDGITRVAAKLGDVMQLNKLYKDVVKTNYSKDISYNSQETDHYFARNVGVIRKDLKADTIDWQLDRFNIVQP